MLAALLLAALAEGIGLSVLLPLLNIALGTDSGVSLPGNETAAHLIDSNRMTIMWCAFEGLPRILRVYGEAETIHLHDLAWDECTSHIPAPVGARQYYRLKIDLVQTSCGFSVPLMDFDQQRDVLTKWAEKRGDEGVHDYWEKKNTVSIDGLPTGILEK